MSATMSFFAVLALVIGAVFVAFPLLRRPGAWAGRADYDVDVYREQLNEVDRDVKRGLLTQTQAAAARLEMQRRLLAADSAARAALGGKHVNDEAAGRAKIRRVFACVILCLVPIGALGVYGILGRPGLGDHPYINQQAERLGITVEGLKARLAQADRMENDVPPKDQRRWLQVAHVRMSLLQPSKALMAYDQAVALGPVSATIWASIGEANVMASDGAVTEQARTAFTRALRQDRSEGRSRYYLGLAQVQDGHAATGLAIWRDLSASSAPWRSVLRGRMAQVAQRENLPPMAVSPAHPLDLADGVATVTVDRDVPAWALADATRPDGQGFSQDEHSMVEAMVQGLKDRLAEQPDDYTGWMRLGRSLRVLQDLSGSAQAYGNAAALKDGSQALPALFNQAVVLLEQSDHAAGGKPGDSFFAVVERIATLDATSPDALYLVGLADALKGQTAAARDKWQTLLATMPTDSAAYKALKKQLDDLES